MKELFAMKPIEIKPSDVTTTSLSLFKEITTRIGNSSNQTTKDEKSDGNSMTYDVYLCYHEAADGYIADILYKYFKSIGINCFLDKKSLPGKSSYGWKTSIVKGG